MRPWFARVVAVALVSAVPLGCAFTPSAAELSNNTGAANSTGNPTGSAATTGQGGAGGGIKPSDRDANCGAIDKPAAKLPPDILIVLDRSGSMNEDMTNTSCKNGCGATSKWALMTPALKQVVTDTQNDVKWGLKYFADAGNNGCAVNTSAAVGIGAGTASMISTSIAGQTTSNGGVSNGSRTPTRLAMNGAVTYLKGLTDNNPKYILLATDGLPNCMPGNSDTAFGDEQGAIDSIKAAAAAGIPTFVVGIATSGIGGADATLSNMAAAGGLARSGTPSYYAVSTGAELASAVQKLVGVAASCRFDIGNAPTDDGTTNLGLIDVYGDNNLIPQDTTHANGYDYVPGTGQHSIEIHGPLCDQIMSGAIKNVTVTFKCTFG